MPVVTEHDPILVRHVVDAHMAEAAVLDGLAPLPFIDDGFLHGLVGIIFKE